MSQRSGGGHRLEADTPKDLSFPAMDSRFRGNDEGGSGRWPREGHRLESDTPDFFIRSKAG